MAKKKFYGSGSGVGGGAVPTVGGGVVNGLKYGKMQEGMGATYINNAPGKHALLPDQLITRDYGRQGYSLNERQNYYSEGDSQVAADHAAIKGAFKPRGA